MNDAPSALGQEIVALIRREVKPAQGELPGFVSRCPVDALSSALSDHDKGRLDKRRCYQRLLAVSEAYKDLGLVDVCGKCAVGPCAFGPAV